MGEGIIQRDSRILIVGAGPAGLCTAWYLKKAGFKNVQVYEKSPRLGGKCRSLTVGGQSFDLGANYITSSYKRVRELARHVGAGMYTERPGHTLKIDANGDPHLQSILSEVLTKTTFFKLAWQALRYIVLRWRLRKLLTPAQPGFAHVPEHPELQGSFKDWLERNNLHALAEMFKIPLTLMGYGKLNEIAAVYGLSYMALGSFKDLGFFAANMPLRRWPKRFNQGYGRMFERLAAEVDVLTGVTIGKITRGDEINVEYRLLEQELEGQKDYPLSDTFDYLVLACPQLPEVLDFMDLSQKESDLFSQVEINPFYVSTYVARGTEKVAAVSFSLPEPQLGQPYVVTRQFPDNDFISIYTRGDREGTITRDMVEKNNVPFLEAIGAKDPEKHSFTVDDWAYFPHVPVEAVDKGFYTELDGLQGTNRTFYCGGLLAFELVECIAEHAYSLVKDRFVGGSKKNE